MTWFLRPDLTATLPALIEIGRLDSVDCWYLCNRKNPIAAQYSVGGMVVNHLAHPIDGSHGLLLPKRHLRRILDLHWSGTADHAMFNAIRHPGVKILQVVKPVLVEHIGEISTYNPDIKMKLEVNYAD